MSCGGTYAILGQMCGNTPLCFGPVLKHVVESERINAPQSWGTHSSTFTKLAHTSKFHLYWFQDSLLL